MMTKQQTATVFGYIALLIFTGPVVRAADPKADLPPDLRRQTERAIHQGLEFLKAAQQRNGGWPGPSIDHGDPAITALVAKGFLQHPDYGPNHPIVTRSVDLILRHQNKDGGIEAPGFGLRNYYTSVCLMFLAAAGDEHALAVAAAQKFLADIQWDESESIDTDNPWYGGAGYGAHKRPDLSNTQLMIEALHESGLPADDPVYQKAIKFIERCQMSSDSNDQPFAREADQGGFIYSPNGGGESKAGTVTIKGRPQLRSYGSMTYAGFKSMLYANVDRKDPRIRNAVTWIRRHYTLDENPNMPGRKSQEGLYYFYHTFARAMYAWGEPTLVDEAGTPHPWRVELCKKLISLQNKDGSWVNDTRRWEESNPSYVTALAVLAMQTALQ